MGTYKVIQDIEADDKLIGWMSPRQAIYAAIVVISLGICLKLATAGAWWLTLFFLPHMILFAVLAGPFMHDQPVEVWLLARIQFSLKPRKRIWNQDGISQLVTITAPKKVERPLTNNLSQSEVKSRLKALATTIDSRGWAVKNINVNLGTQPMYVVTPSDRLVAAPAGPQEVPYYDVTAQDDILDERSNATAQQLDQMLSQSTQAYRQQVITTMHQGKPVTKREQWFTEPAKQATKPKLGKVRVASTRKEPDHSHMTPAKNKKPTAEKPNPEVQQLAQNDDWTVATIARQANKKDDSSDDNEVVISLR